MQDASSQGRRHSRQVPRHRQRTPDLRHDKSVSWPIARYIPKMSAGRRSHLGVGRGNAMAHGKFVLAALLLTLAGCAPVTKGQSDRSFVSRPGGWIKVSNRDCQAYQAVAGPGGGGVATWSGSCDGQYISGPGELAWYTQKTPTGYYDIKYFIALLQGNSSQGKLEGPGKLITRQGVIDGTWQNGVLVSQSNAPVETNRSPPSPAVADGNAVSQVDSKFSKMLDQLVSEDSRSWASNKYDSGSMRAGSPSNPGDSFVVTGNYTFNEGNSGWVKAHFADGKISCMEYWDFAGNCRQVGQGLGATREVKSAAPSQTGIRPFNALRYYQEQQRQENAREMLMEENNSHQVQPLDRNDSNYERANSPD